MADRAYASHGEFYAQVYRPAVVSLRVTGGLGAQLLHARQTPGDWSDAPVPDLVITRSLGRPVRVQFDVGAGRVRQTAPTNSYCVVPPNTSTLFLMDDPHEIRALALPYAKLLALAGPDSGLPPDGSFGILHREMIHDEVLGHTTAALWAEADAGNPNGALWADGAVLQLAARLLCLARGGVVPPPNRRLPEVRLARAAEVLRSHLDADLGLTEVAREAGMSPFHFARQFRAMFGLSPVQYRIMARIETAQHLLRTTRLPVAEIARHVGYADLSRFGAQFKARVGLTPAAFRAARGW